MIDQSFINDIVKSGHTARELSAKEFSSLTTEQINWKPSQKGWSIAECLEHLIISNRVYFNVFESIANRSYKMSRKEKFSPLTSVFGSLMKSAMQAEPKRKMVTHKTLNPISSSYEVKQVDLYDKNCSTLLNHISNCKDIDLDKTVITSPTLGFITYSIRDAFTFLITHQHRHINQGIRVKECVDFPR